MIAKGSPRTRDPRHWRVGKSEKQSTNRFVRRWRSSTLRRFLGKDEGEGRA